jgi:hypothetical protein
MSKKIDEKHSQDAIVELVSQAKHRPLPRSTKALAVFVIVGMIFTGGIAYGKHRATSSTGAGLSLAGLSAGGFGSFGGGFGGGRNRNGGAAGTAGTLSNGSVTGGTSGFGAGAASSAITDVAGTIVSITATSVVIQTLSGAKQTFPLLTNTRVRVSTAGVLSGVKPGDIVTIKPDEANAAKTITLVK